MTGIYTFIYVHLTWFFFIYDLDIIFGLIDGSGCQEYLLLKNGKLEGLSENRVWNGWKMRIWMEVSIVFFYLLVYSFSIDDIM